MKPPNDETSVLEITNLAAAAGCTLKQLEALVQHMFDRPIERLSMRQLLVLRDHLELKGGKTA
jgi:hypothetical protein